MSRLPEELCKETVVVGSWRAVGDYHTHTYFSRPTHASGSVEENAAVARERGLSEVAVTDHGPAGWWYGLESEDRFYELEAEVNRVRKDCGQLKLLLGLEANIVSLEGDIDVPVDIMNRLDILLVGFHPYVHTRSAADSIQLLARNVLQRALPQGLAQLARFCSTTRRQNTRALIRAVERHPVDIVTHPGLNIDIDTLELARACAATETALELNASHRHSTVEFVRTAGSTGVNFVVNSDAHSPQQVGRVEWAMQRAQEAGLAAEAVSNVIEVEGSRPISGEE